MNNITSTIAMNDIMQDDGSTRTPETTSTISTNGVAKDGNDNLDIAFISKPGAKTNFKEIKWSELDICVVTKKPCGVDGVPFEKLGAKDIRSIGISLKIPRSRSSKKRVLIDAI